MLLWVYYLECYTTCPDSEVSSGTEWREVTSAAVGVLLRVLYHMS